MHIKAKVKSIGSEFDEIFCEPGHVTVTVIKEPQWDNEPFSARVYSLELNAQEAAELEIGQTFLLIG